MAEGLSRMIVPSSSSGTLGTNEVHADGTTRVLPSGPSIRTACSPRVQIRNTAFPYHGCTASVIVTPVQPASGLVVVWIELLQLIAIVTLDTRPGVQRETVGLVAERVRSGAGHMRGRRSGGVIAQRLDRTARLGAERDA